MAVWNLLMDLIPFEWASHGFMRSALLAVLVISPLFGLLSTMVVSNRMSFFSDALGHSAFTGIAIGTLCGLADPLWMAVLLAAVFALLFTYVRRAVAYPDRLELQSALGRTRSVRWQDIIEVKTAVTSKRVTLRTAKETVSVNGDPRHYRTFVQQLYNHVPAHVGSDTLGQLLQRLN